MWLSGIGRVLTYSRKARPSGFAALPKSSGESSLPRSSVSFLEIMRIQCRQSRTQAYYRYWSNAGAAVNEMVATLPTTKLPIPIDQTVGNNPPTPIHPFTTLPAGRVAPRKPSNACKPPSTSGRRCHVCALFSKRRVQCVEVRCRSAPAARV